MKIEKKKGLFETFKECDSKGSISISYADNEIRRVDIVLSLEALDWYKLSTRSDFLYLIQYLYNQEILKKHSIPREAKCLLGIQE